MLEFNCREDVIRLLKSELSYHLDQYEDVDLNCIYIYWGSTSLLEDSFLPVIDTLNGQAALFQVE